MKRTIIMLFICGGLVWGCNPNQRSSKAYGKKGSSAAYKPTEISNDNTSSELTREEGVTTKESEQPNTHLDSLLMSPEGTYTKPRVNFQGSTGVGTGGSYASSSYRHDEMNRKKYEKEALAKMNERKKLNEQKMQAEDSLSSKADSIQYLW